MPKVGRRVNVNLFAIHISYMFDGNCTPVVLCRKHDCPDRMAKDTGKRGDRNNVEFEIMMQIDKKIMIFWFTEEERKLKLYRSKNVIYLLLWKNFLLDFKLISKLINQDLTDNSFQLCNLVLIFVTILELKILFPPHSFYTCAFVYLKLSILSIDAVSLPIKIENVPFSMEI